MCELKPEDQKGKAGRERLVFQGLIEANKARKINNLQKRWN
jgi:hypothetical protein